MKKYITLQATFRLLKHYFLKIFFLLTVLNFFCVSYFYQDYHLDFWNLIIKSLVLGMITVTVAWYVLTLYLNKYVTQKKKIIFYLRYIKQCR